MTRVEFRRLAAAVEFAAEIQVAEAEYLEATARLCRGHVSLSMSQLQLRIGTIGTLAADALAYACACGWRGESPRAVTMHQVRGGFPDACGGPFRLARMSEYAIEAARAALGRSQAVLPGLRPPQGRNGR